MTADNAVLAGAVDGRPAGSPVLIEPQGPVLHLVLNRPHHRNALTPGMVTALRAALADAEADGRTRVLVLRGAGGHFCAGADLKGLTQPGEVDSGGGTADGPGTLGDPLAEANAGFGRLCAAFAASPLAVVAVLEGTVMGGGVGLACIADLALATETASFRLPETSLGIVPAQIAPYLVERLGYSQARRLAVTGGRLDAAAALAIGLVHAVHPTGQLDDALSRSVHDILCCAPQALAATKALMARARLTPAADLVAPAAALFARSARGPEGTEGSAAFIGKRRPAWAPDT